MQGKTQTLVFVHVAILLSAVACAAHAGDNSPVERDQTARYGDDRGTDGQALHPLPEWQLGLGSLLSRRLGRRATSG